MRNILGLDLGTTSIGWAFISEVEKGEVASSFIKRIGVRVNPLSTTERKDFEGGRPATINADRTRLRGTRRLLKRYKERRAHLVSVLIKYGLINNESLLAEKALGSTHATYKLRSQAVSSRVNTDELARILLMINKKRGYKSSRKIQGDDLGQAVDGMATAKKMLAENISPGELCKQLAERGSKETPEFYRSDLELELKLLWTFQSSFYLDVLTDALFNAIKGQNKTTTTKLFFTFSNITPAINSGKEKKDNEYSWRSTGLKMKLPVDQVAYIIIELNNYIASSSKLLSAISDRSKDLFFNNETVGQYLYKRLENDPNAPITNMAFYRQDYIEEFDAIWKTQSKYHPALTPKLKAEIQNNIIFYQRKLKSQKGLVGFCEFESKRIVTNNGGSSITKTTGARVTPRASPLFQEFKIHQALGNLILTNKTEKIKLELSDEHKSLLFNQLNIKGNLTKLQVLKLLNCDSSWDLNFSSIEGNRTNQELYQAYFKMMELDGHDNINYKNMSAGEMKQAVKSFFTLHGINLAILEFNSEAEGSLVEQQPFYEFWHLLYSYETDDSISGYDHLYNLLQKKYGFKVEFSMILTGINLQSDYAELSAKAIKNILTYIKDNKYSEACQLAGYNHSSYLTKEQNLSRVLKPNLELLPKNSLRNPVVEKILNQLVNVINTIISDPALGKPDEIRIEIARELKKNREERKELSSQISKAKGAHDEISKLLINELGIKSPTRNDVIRYKLYDELKFNGYKDLYTNEYISREDLFSNKYNVDHIISQAQLFDDSFSNKTLISQKTNLDKRNRTAFDYISEQHGQDKLDEYIDRITALYKKGGISKAKYNKLQKKESEIGEGFIARDLRDTQYIAKKATAMLFEICRTVVTTTGSITARLREDWDLINVMQELSIDKYRALGLTQKIEKRDGSFKEVIIDWTKRNDHRHHAMDALTIAFTQHSHIQYLNNLNARGKADKKGREIYGIEQNITVIDDKGKRRFKAPMSNFRSESKKHLENVLVSIKAKNKISTINKNKTNNLSGGRITIQLTPRGALHEATVYRKIKVYRQWEEVVNAKFDESKILTVVKKEHREALMKRLQNHNMNPVAAFSGKNALLKTPIYLDDEKIDQIPKRIIIGEFEDDFIIKKDVNPDIVIDKIIDKGIQTLLRERLAEFKGQPKDAFSNLDMNPIWINKEKGIAVKSVRISNAKNAEAIHFKRNHSGDYLLDGFNKPIPTDYVRTGNNHHAAIYLDENGKWQDDVVSFYRVITARLKNNLSTVDDLLNQDIGWKFLFTIKQNEYFVFPSKGFDPLKIDLTNPANNKIISPNLFRVQKFSKPVPTWNSSGCYYFRHHLDTTVDEKPDLKDITFKRITSLIHLQGVVKVRINHIGEIVLVGE